MLFVINYSRIDIFHSVSDSGHIRSNVERSAHYQRELKQHSEHIYVMRLKGYIFFGTANQILDQVRERVNDPEKLKVQFVVMDFQRVGGMDVSTIISFSRLLQLAGAHGFTVVMTNLKSDFSLQLHALTTGEDADYLKFMHDLDRGLEWCEEHILDMVGATKKHIPVTIPHQLEGYGLSRDLGVRLEEFLEAIRVEDGESLIKQGDPASDLYFIVVGQVSIYFQATDGRRIRLRTMGAGTIVGEIGFFLNRQRSADVVADTTSLIRSLSKASLERMRNEDPELALAFKEMILRIVAERLIATNHALAAHQ